MDETQHYLIELLISYINEVNKDLEEKLVTKNDELVNDDDNIYSDPLELHIDDLFQDWDIKSGVNKPKKIEDIDIYRDNTSGKTDYPWEISFYLAKQTGKIRLIKFINNHNHQCDTKTIELAPKNLRFPQSILNKIE
ncbi:hypothetical protein RclHR1_04710009 [Rhizophagus clarus]|uniref:FAR1 domain-containing protein n=1 Tax=Rhizophagus clarus TaxID=94130 RepID=A0A2Z6RKC4_9GLOM|nr:hypothetical protein RclHR1_04710009 [Rhizophagus clarus]GES77418.1 hypothetical protein RCL_jg12252.t1 [Rhizophagus clarus]